MSITTTRPTKPLIFVAATYEGNIFEWANGLLRSAASIRAAADVVPILPHLRLIVIDPADRIDWELDLISRCDGLVVLGGTEGGVEDRHGISRWLEAAEVFEVPIFRGPGQLIDWVRAR
jgi:hypothetical protein